MFFRMSARSHPQLIQHQRSVTAPRVSDAHGTLWLQAETNTNLMYLQFKAVHVSIRQAEEMTQFTK